ncbi:MAG: ROK family protein, partial [Cetobacterium sp.]
MRYYIGIDIGGTKMASLISDENFNILSRKFFPTSSVPSPLKTIEKIVKNIYEQLD